MPTVKSDEVRIPRQAREAVARHEQVTVLNRERPVLVIVHPDDLRPTVPTRRGRPWREVVAALARAPRTDPNFVEDMEAVLASVGEDPPDPWAQS